MNLARRLCSTPLFPAETSKQADPAMPRGSVSRYSLIILTSPYHIS